MNLKRFDEHNKNESNTHSMGINFFADMLPEDLKKQKPVINQASKIVKPFKGDDDESMMITNFNKKADSKSIDWT